MIYVTALMKKASIDWEATLDNPLYPPRTTDAISSLLEYHFGKWGKLDGIRKESIFRVSGKKLSSDEK